MLPEAIELVIVTPTRQLVRTRTREVTLPGANGYLGILPGHAPLMTELGIGELTFQGAQKPEPLSVIRGFAEVLPDRVTVLAEIAKARAEKRLAAGAPDMDWDRAGVALQRALIRIQVARKFRGVPANSH